MVRATRERAYGGTPPKVARSSTRRCGLVPWLAHVQAHGRLEHASNPFICSVDTALETMVTDYEHLAAIAWELGRPDNEDAAQNLAARRDNATRFVEALHDGGATRNAERLAPIIHRKADPQPSLPG